MRKLMQDVNLWSKYISDPHIHDSKHTLEDDAIINAMLYRIEEKAVVYRRNNPDKFRHSRGWPLGSVSVWCNARKDYHR
jgi:hypothetical protein